MTAGAGLEPRWNSRDHRCPATVTSRKADQVGDTTAQALDMRRHGPHSSLACHCAGWGPRPGLGVQGSPGSHSAEQEKNSQQAQGRTGQHKPTRKWPRLEKGPPPRVRGPCQLTRELTRSKRPKARRGPRAAVSAQKGRSGWACRVSGSGICRAGDTSM